MMITMGFVDQIINAIQYDFIRKGLLAGVVIALGSSLTGSFLVLRKNALITDGLSHVTFAAVALALLLGANTLIVSIPLVIAASILISFLGKSANIYNDTAIGLVSAFSLAAGLILMSLKGGFNFDINSYLFGSILAVENYELIVAGCVSVAALIFMVVYYNDLFLMTFDEDAAKIGGTKIKFINISFTVIQSVIIVIGVKIVGALLMSSMIMFPSVTALQFAKSFKVMSISTVIISIISVIIGIMLSIITNLPAGASIVMTNAAAFVIAYLSARLFKIK